jgi:hypothetical protein
MPEHVAGTKRDILRLSDVLAAGGQPGEGEYLRLHASERLKCEPASGHPPDLKFFPSFVELTSPEAYVALIERGELWADAVNAAVVGRGNALIFDLSLGHESRPREHWFFKAEEMEPRWLDGALAPVTIRPWWGRSYYHWMFEILPRFHLLSESGCAIDAFALHDLSESFQRETLGLLGIRPADLIRLESPVRLRAEKLIVTPVLPSLAPSWVCTFLRGLILAPGVATDGKKIYVSREEASRGRKVENNAEVVEALGERGFRQVVLEGMSVREQAGVFASAELVVAPHGSGLANLVFCQAGTRVIEMFAPTYVHPLYWMLSNRAGLTYYFLIGCGKGAKSWDAWPQSKGVDSMTIDIRNLIDLVKRAEG